MLLSSAPVKQVIAAAGSGKTRTVIQLASQVLSGPSARWEAQNARLEDSARRPLLLLTFSRKACSEMRERLPDAAKDRADVNTFHGFCFRTIRLHYPGGAHYKIVDEEEKIEILKPLFRRYRYEIGGIPYALLLANPGYFRQEFPEAAFRIFRYWEQYKQKHKCLEYQDLIRMTLSGLRKAWSSAATEGGASSWAAGLAGSYHTIIVDEFQDTDPAQLEFLKLMKPQKLVVVGDDWQSIYSFRGADVRPFLDFRSHFPETRKFFLSVNYRSLPSIVEAGNRLIKQSSGQIRKKVRARRQDRSAAAFCVVAGKETEREVLEKLALYKSDRVVLCRSNHRRNQWLEAGVAGANCLTVHRAKGLEFSMVLLDVLGGWSGASDPDSRNEEIRIAYVALTRAKNLFIALGKSEYGNKTGDAFIWAQLFQRFCQKTSFKQLQRRIATETNRS